eukprot:gene54542-60225_t
MQDPSDWIGQDGNDGLAMQMGGFDALRSRWDCRICHGGGGAADPLFSPCRCAGS